MEVGNLCDDRALGDAIERVLKPAFFGRDSITVARALLNCLIVRDTSDGLSVVRISETEAYFEKDPASHTYGGRTARNKSMFGPAGCAYVYLTYGIHYCLNAVAAREGLGEGVLIRAGEPVFGWELMLHRRGLTQVHERDLTPDPSESVSVITDTLKGKSNPNDGPLKLRMSRLLCSGPGKLCQSLSIDRSLDGKDLTHGSDLWFCEPTDPHIGEIVASPRIGISQAVNEPLRFTLAGDIFTSRSGR